MTGTSHDPKVESSGGERSARIPILVVLSLLWLTGLVVVAALGTLVAPQNPLHQDVLTGLVGPGGDHPLGTDELGRDVLSRLIAGARTAVVGPLLVSVGAMIIGVALGLSAGYRGGYVDFLVMRWVDLMFALPSLLLAIVLVGILDGGYWLGVAVILLLSVPHDTRIVRAATLERRNLSYVEAAQCLGLSANQTMTRHILPTLKPLLLAHMLLTFSFALVSLAGLSFLGLGSGPQAPDWGRMLSDSVPLMYTNPMMGVAPAVLIAGTAVSVNLVGDWLESRGKERSGEAT